MFKHRKQAPEPKCQVVESTPCPFNGQPFVIGRTDGVEATVRVCHWHARMLRGEA